MGYKKILVPINGTKVDEEVIGLACRLAKISKAEIYAAYVIELERSLPLDAEVASEVEKGEKALDMAEKIARSYNYGVETDLLQARDVGPALLDEALERKVDLIIIGLSYKTRFGEFSLGSTVPYLLKNAPCRVMIYREPRPSG